MKIKKLKTNFILFMTGKKEIYLVFRNLKVLNLI